MNRVIAFYLGVSGCSIYALLLVFVYISVGQMIIRQAIDFDTLFLTCLFIVIFLPIALILLDMCNSYLSIVSRKHLFLGTFIALSLPFFGLLFL